jgi:uncharacterized protein
VAQTDNIPTLASLALQYGTIDNDQYRHLTALHALQKKDKLSMDYARLLLGQKFATRYQIGLLKLIQEYHIVKKRGEEFGKIAIEKGFASQLDVQKALEFQKKEFKRARVKKLIGDILVESRVITTKQKNDILKEQQLLEQRADKILTDSPEETDPESRSIPKKEPVSEDDSELSVYEKKFLRIKVLDREFAAQVIEKGLASEREVTIAQRVQEEEFEKENSLKILGDVMVTLGFITDQQKKIILRDQIKSEDTPNSKETDSGLEVIISPDEMTAWVKIDQHFLSQTTVPKLKAVLNAHGISHGIYPDPLLQGHLNAGNLEIPAARSEGSSKLMDPKNLEFYLENNLTEKGEKRKGDQLAKCQTVPDTLLIKDIFGKDKKRTLSKTLFNQCGSGTRPSHDGASIIATKTGIPSLSVERKVFIHPIIHVLEDADLRYGPLEAYANLSISGVLTGAYPITAGSIKAREIRGARIESIGTIRADVGITDTIIRSQGDIHARYLHNCQIETFGNIYIDNEIFDSKIIISGKIDSPGCRIISSNIFAKQGVRLAGVGSERTKSCTVTAGGEHHILELEKKIYREIDRISKKIDTLKEKQEEQERHAQKLFQKMIELKIFHDRAKEKRLLLVKEFKKNKGKAKRAKLKNIAVLISNFEKRIERSIASLKEINTTKKLHDTKKIEVEKKIISLTPETNAAIKVLKEKMFLFYEWTRCQKNISKIEITGKVFPGTHFSGIYASTEIESSIENFSVKEICDSTENYRLEILQNPGTI